MQANYLDASAAVKLVVEEPGSDNIRAYFQNRGKTHSAFFMTRLCLDEALGVLKHKWLKVKVSREQYIGISQLLQSCVRNHRIVVDDVDLSDNNTFNKAEELVRRYNLDLSDALQIFTLKHGKFRFNSLESKSILITADGSLADAAREEGLRVWNCQKTAHPPN